MSAADSDGQGLQRQATRNAALADERADLAIDGGDLAVRVHRTLALHSLVHHAALNTCVGRRASAGRCLFWSHGWNAKAYAAPHVVVEIQTKVNKVSRELQMLYELRS